MAALHRTVVHTRWAGSTGTDARLDRSHDGVAEGILSADVRPARLTRITLRPVITFGAPVAEERARHLVGVAHRECFIAGSLRTEIVVEPTLRTVPGLS
jgi:organic hydroperoxide reductase OsmC/OhrA